MSISKPAPVSQVAAATLKGRTEGGLRQLRQLLSRGSMAVELFVRQDGALALLLQGLSNPATQVQACGCLTNIAASVSEHCQLALAAAPQLAMFLSGTDPVMHDYAAWALGNLAGDGPAARDLLLAQGIFPLLLPLLASEHVNVVHSAAFAVSNLVRGQGAPIAMLLDSRLPQVLLDALAEVSHDVFAAAQILYIFVYMTGSPAVSLLSSTKTNTL
jgi:hypothetical protein